MRTIIASRLLRNTLIADAVASGALALLQVLGHAPLARLTALPAALLLATGLFLAGYVALLGLMARAGRLPVWLVTLVVAGNIGWALGCMALAGGAAGLAANSLGTAYLLAQAAAVLVFAELEYAGLRRSRPAGEGATRLSASAI